MEADSARSLGHWVFRTKGFSQKFRTLGFRTTSFRTQHYSPDGVEPNSLVPIARQLGNEGEVANLHRRPAKLEDDDRKREIHNLNGQVRRLTPQATVPDEEHGYSHHDGTYEMPQFASSVTGVGLVAQEPDDGRGSCIDNLTNEDEETSVCVPQLHHLVEEQDQVCEPHAGTEVVEDVPHAIRQLPEEGEARSGHTDDSPSCAGLDARPGGNIPSLSRRSCLVVWGHFTRRLRAVATHAVPQSSGSVFNRQSDRTVLYCKQISHVTIYLISKSLKVKDRQQHKQHISYVI